jgi:hypothetical protein
MAIEAFLNLPDCVGVLFHDEDVVFPPTDLLGQVETDRAGSDDYDLHDRLPREGIESLNDGGDIRRRDAQIGHHSYSPWAKAHGFDFSLGQEMEQGFGRVTWLHVDDDDIGFDRVVYRQQGIVQLISECLGKLVVGGEARQVVVKGINTGSGQDSDLTHPASELLSEPVGADDGRAVAR